MKHQTHRARQFLAALFLTTALVAGGPASVLAGNSDSDRLTGSPVTLNVLGDIYWRSAFGSVVLPADPNGNAVIGGVALMPLPDNSANPTASINVTLKAGQPFFLPLLALFGTSYSDGTPSDPVLTESMFKKHLKQLKLQIDGRLLLGERDALDFLTQFNFEPPIPYDAAPINAIIYEQGISVIHKGLSPGPHVIKLDVKFSAAPPGFAGFEFHNTFNVTVVP